MKCYKRGFLRYHTCRISTKTYIPCLLLITTPGATAAAVNCNPPAVNAILKTPSYRLIPSFAFTWRYASFQHLPAPPLATSRQLHKSPFPTLAHGINHTYPPRPRLPKRSSQPSTSSGTRGGDLKSPQLYWIEHMYLPSLGHPQPRHHHHNLEVQALPPTSQPLNSCLHPRFTRSWSQAQL